MVHARPVRHGRPGGDGRPRGDGLLAGDARPVGGLLADLTDAQREAVVSDAAPLCVLAGAGSGKTRVLTRRVAHRCLTGDADPAHVLVLTFTRKAAGELSARLSALGLRDRVAAGTFHAVAAAQLRRWWADRGQAPPGLLTSKARLLAPLAAERPGLAGVAVAELAGHLEWANARCVPPADFPAAAAASGRRLAAPASELAALFARYEHEKLRRGLIDFDDLLARCADALERDPTFAAAQRWRWRHVFVDEFQDVNPLQHRLLLGWLGDRTDLCIVGDPHQAIYGWNGADPHLLDEVPVRWPATQVIHLDSNHRCSPQIVAAAGEVLGVGGARLSSAREEGAPVSVRAWATADAEAVGVAGELCAAHAEGLPWRSMAVLTRTNAQAALIAEACRSAGVAIRVPGRQGLLEMPAVRMALARLQENAGAPLAVAVADLGAWAGDAVPRAGAGAGAGAGGGTAAAVNDHEAAGALQALAELARQAQHLDPAATIASWVATLPALLGRDPDAILGEAVTICSFHRAKGLEWHAVWVCGLEDGFVPIGHATSPAALAEERRLLYVALTRASERLTCSWARERRFGERPVPRLPSPWLPAVAVAGDGTTSSPATPEEWQERIRVQRDRLRAGRAGTRPSRLPAAWPTPEAHVLEALRAWRAAAARASLVPAHVVLHDTVVEAIASLRPSDEAALLAIPGMGPVKASRYGPALLRLVRQAGEADRAASASSA